MAASFACICLVLANPAIAASSLKQGMEAYKKNDYKEAIRLLNKAEAEDPYNAELHYYLANCYVFQHDGESAIKQYSRCFDLEPLSKYGQYSRQALLGFGKKFRGFSGPDDGKEHLAPDDPKSINQAVALIRKQTEDQDKRAHSSGEKAAESAIQKGESHAQQINKDAQQLSEDLAPLARSQAAQEELHEIRQKAVFAGQHARFEAQQQAAKHMEHAAQNAISLESSAASLLRLMSEDPKPGHIKLKALGTNLYVRNYGMEPKPPLEPLLAEWELIGASKPKAELARSVTPGPVLRHNLAKEKVSGPDPPTLPAPTSKTNAKTPELNVPNEKTPELTCNKGAMCRGDAMRRPQSYEKSSEFEFVPGSSKVLVTDMRGKVLLHVKEKNRQDK